MTALRTTVTEGERLRTLLLDVVRLTPTAERGGVVTDLVMFYGRAFGVVAEAITPGYNGTMPNPADLTARQMVGEWTVAYDSGRRLLQAGRRQSRPAGAVARGALDAFKAGGGKRPQRRPRKDE